MSLAIGSRVGNYEVLALLGVGAMGEVYRVRDTKLGRDVALKILPEAFAADAERLTRFEQEARTLASLNHPNIAQIYGLEQTGQTTALAMELVRGEDLAQRIARGPLTIDETLLTARQIAQALEAAHEAGVVHRDLKPANIKVRDDGAIKILDFGLAKAGAPGPASAAPAGSSDAAATMPPLAMTMHGVILGTAAYMAPEQAKGKPVDRRADIWAFGVVLYEMLTGRGAFSGETVTDVLASVIEREPDWTALPQKTPAAVRRLLARCLEKDVRRRLRDIGDANLELEAAKDEPPQTALPAPTRSPRIALPWSIAALSVVALAAVLLTTRAPASPVVPAARLDLTLPADQRVSTLLGQSVAISPDGRKVAYVAQELGTRRVYVHELDTGTTVAMPGTEFAQGVYFSPLGDAVGFVNSDRGVYRLSLSGGSPTHMAQQTEYSNGAWADAGFFISRDRVLFQIPLSGEAKQLTALAADSGDLSHTAPQVLPGGRAVVFTVWGKPFPGRVELLTLADGKRRTLAAPGVIPVFSAGHVLFANDGALLALPFDAERLEATGDPFVVLPKGELHGAMTGSPYFAATASGTLVYLPSDSTRRRLVWVSRDGSERPLSDVRGAYGNPRLSPDGRRVVVEERGAALWVVDLARQTRTRVLSRAFVSGRGLWLGGGTRLLFKSWDDVRVMDTESDSSGRIVTGLAANDLPTAVHPDGDTLAFTRADGHNDIFVASIGGKQPPRPLVATPRNDLAASFSPDGRWLLYNADDSGRFEVYLGPYPAADRRWQVSTGGGVEPRWSADGREIYYRQGAAMIAVRVTLGPTPLLSDAVKLFEGAYAFGEDRTSINYDVSADGRFVMIRDDSNSRLTVVLNWPVALGQGTAGARDVSGVQQR